MAQSVLDSSWVSSTSESFNSCFNLRIGEGNPVDVLAELEVSTSSSGHNNNVPQPPPLPGSTFSKGSFPNRLLKSSYVPKETVDTWDKLFEEGYGADVHILTEDQTIIPAHSSILGTASPVLRIFLKDAKVKDGIQCIKIPGTPFKAVHAFIRFLYSSRYEDDDMKKYVLHLLLLSHSFSVPALKRVCKNLLEQALLTQDNVIDVLQLARLCDAPHLSLFCVRMVVKDFKTISASEGWKVMKRVNPALEQELLESVVEADSRKQENMKKIEDKKMYLQLHEAMEALLHICRDGCRTVGPRDQTLKVTQITCGFGFPLAFVHGDQKLKGTQITCGFPACKGLETLVRHFSICKIRVPGGCVHCKRMWQLLELHSRMCNEPDSCKVPLCRHFKEKLQQQSKKDEAKWKLLVRKVIEAKPR